MALPDSQWQNIKLFGGGWLCNGVGGCSWRHVFHGLLLDPEFLSWHRTKWVAAARN
ncbi:hypothetical protein N008_20205 [Hymenobacter sp. APR13]|nr:hypothetical protein N008_20205 [Hymenobacter sp. APR13]